MLLNTLTGWARRTFAAGGPLARPRSFRPAVETLESRDPAALMVSPGINPAQLVQSLLGPGVQAFNVKFTGVPVAEGTFTGGQPSVGFDSGIALSTGLVSDLPQTNDVQASTDNGQPGDPQLDAIVAPNMTHDASVLEFDFIPTGSTLSFNYVFGSEEYNEFVNSGFNDVFAFFVNGQNVALLPGTNTPVAIDTVNLKSNAQFYRNNAPPGDPSPTNSPLPIVLDGLTTVLPATVSVNPGQMNHIKLAIADTQDSIFDSDVFIQAGSFAAPMPPPVPNFTVYYPFRYIEDPATGLLRGNLTLTNTNNTFSADAPFKIIFPALPAGFTLVNASGTTGGAPFIQVAPPTSIPPEGSFRVQIVLHPPTIPSIAPSTFFIGFPVAFSL